ncbi:secretion-regulating guanine nucleotide exchange factor isoform X4 [Aphelocoma coerulescens]|uniref:secretion-regulating guanine nucleotide exchange factor isoform X4 n=1 Tax=Aphelocoma coerulescens TaxID=39617 RepID=UPI0036052C36
MEPRLFAWGANSYGQLGLGHKEDVLVPQALKDVSCKCQDIASIAGGGGHSTVITGAGQLFVCGHNKDGQLGLNHTEDVLRFTLCTALSGFCVKQVACGWDFTIILDLAYCCPVGQTLLDSWDFLKFQSLKEKVVNVAAGLRHALAATDSGLVLQWGTGMASRAKRASQGKALPVFLTAKEPCEVTGLEDVKVKTVAAGSYHSVSLTDEGCLYVWGSNKHGQLVSRDIFLAEPKKIDTQCFSHEKIGAVWSGWTHLVARTEAGKVFTWGRADYRQLGRHAGVPGGQQSTVSEHCLELLCNIPVSVPCLNGASQRIISSRKDFLQCVCGYKEVSLAFESSSRSTVSFDLQGDSIQAWQSLSQARYIQHILLLLERRHFYTVEA